MQSGKGLGRLGSHRTYSHALALWLHGAGHRVSLLNPRRVKQYARSAGKRNKTDLLDAAIIADFVCALKPATWQPPMLEVAQLQALGASP